MLQELTSRKAYTAAIAAQIEAMGQMAISVANRWVMGWPQRVKGLVKSGQYLECLETQVAYENDILAKTADLRHLARHEIMQMYEIREAPPFL
ncbi:hypothetical protein GALL_463550 [mine drainage metagenome]|uniref:Uncharacterized protein n=1 Tax=mine drainage metagenome TaxID=410659 RepID=A0A1J5Q7V1_9ZZZZ